MDYESALRFAAKTAFEVAEKKMAAAGDSANRKEIDTNAMVDAWYMFKEKPEVVEYAKRTYGDDRNKWVIESMMTLNFAYEEIRYTEGIKRYAENISMNMGISAIGVLGGDAYPRSDQWKEIALKNQDKEFPSLTWDEKLTRSKALIEKHKSLFLNLAASIAAYEIQEKEPGIMHAIVYTADPELMKGGLYEDIKEFHFDKLRQDLIDVYLGKSITINKRSIDEKDFDKFLGRSSNDPYSLNKEDVKLIRSHCVENLNATGVDGKWCFDALNTTEINAVVKTAIILGEGNALAPLPPANEIVERYGDAIYQGVLFAWAEKNKRKVKAYRFWKKIVFVVVPLGILAGIVAFLTYLAD